MVGRASRVKCMYLETNYSDVLWWVGLLESKVYVYMCLVTNYSDVLWWVGLLESKVYVFGDQLQCVLWWVGLLESNVYVW